MEKVDISVVLPVYNAEKYLEQCLESLEKQTKSNIEIIFVDDGSKDKSVQIIEAHQKLDSRIRLIKQANQYAGVARNNGMAHAVGKYILFLDSDDFFERRMLEELYTTAEKYQSEILLFGYYVFDEKTKKRIKMPFPNLSECVVSAKELGKSIFDESFMPAAWNKFYLKSFVDKSGLKFQPYKNTNDMFFSRMTMAVSERICCLKKRFVNYRINNENSIQGGKKKDVTCTEKALLSIREELIKRELYSNDFSKALEKTALTSIRFVERKIQTKEELKAYYEYTKQNFIPMFKDTADIEQYQEAYLIDQSDSFEDYLFKSLFWLRKQINQKSKNESLKSKIVLYVSKLCRV